jgi:hypothetical protein
MLCSSTVKKSRHSKSTEVLLLIHGADFWPILRWFDTARVFLDGLCNAHFSNISVLSVVQDQARYPRALAAWRMGLADVGGNAAAAVGCLLEWGILWELSSKLLRAAWACTDEDGQPEPEPSSFLLLSHDEIAELRQQGRHLTSEQRVAFVTALSAYDEPIHIDIVYNHLDAEAEAYAAQFSALLVPLGFAGSFVPVSDIGSGLEGLVVRVNSESIPTLALRLLNALIKAKIDHRIERLTGDRALLSPDDYFDLAVGQMKGESDYDRE